MSKVTKGILSALVICSIGAQAQDVLPFSATLTAANELPPNNDPTIAVGGFTLTGNSLSFQLWVPAWSFISADAYLEVTLFGSISLAQAEELLSSGDGIGHCIQSVNDNRSREDSGPHRW
jgi:hypothetical protein